MHKWADKSRDARHDHVENVWSFLQNLFGSRRNAVSADRMRAATQSRRGPPPPPPPAPERAERTAMFRNGTLAMPDGGRLSVAISDLNEYGARVDFAGHLDLPDRVTLIEPRAKLRREATVVWRKQGAAGLAFDP